MSSVTDAVMDRDSPGDSDQALALTRGEIIFGTFVLSMAPFLAILDMTMVNVILPHVAGSYGATPSEGTLVITFFAVAQAISMTLSGWLTNRFGVVRTFTFALLGFAVSSFLCGISPSLNGLIVARVLQGLAAGPIVPLSQAIMQRTFPPKAAATGLTIWGVAMMTGPLLGPTLGGILADTVGWSWGFFVNVPIAISCMIMAQRVFSRHEGAIARMPIDFIGLLFMVVCVGALQFVLDYGSRMDWLASPVITTLGIVALISFVLFLIWELTEQHPVVDLSIFRYRAFWVVSIISAVSYGLTVGSSVITYLWLQTTMGYTATWAGYVAATAGIPSLFVGPIAGYLSARIDLRWMATIGLVLSGLVNIVRAGFTTSVDFGHLLIPQILVGFAGPFYFAPLISIAMHGLPKEKISSAAGLITVSRTFAFAILTAILTTLWEHDTKRAYWEFTGLVNPTTYEAAMPQAEASPERGLAVLNMLLRAEASTQSMAQVLLLSGLLTLLCAIAIWFTPKVTFHKAAAPITDH